MTPYSITSDQQKSPTHPEMNSGDWESQMAKLVGLAEAPVETVEIAPNQPSLVSPQEVKTEQPLSSNPFAKLALVGTATLAVVVLAGGFLSQLMSANNQQPVRKITVTQAEPPATSFTPQQNLEQEVETLKTKLALAEQSQAVKVAQQNLRNAPRVVVAQTPPTSAPLPRVSVFQPPQTVARLAPTPTPPTPPRTVVVERLAQPYTPPLPVVSPPPPVAQAPTPPSPWEQWSRLAKIGSYGQANAVNQPSMTVSSPPPLTPPRPPVTNNGYPPPQTPPGYAVSQASSRSPQSLKVGTKAKAVLATAVFGETTRGRGGSSNTENNDNKNLFVIRLQEPLKGIDGTIAVAANTELLTEVQSVSEQGVMQLNIVKMVVQNNGNLSERDIPNNSLTIRGANGSPLLARQYPDRGSSIAGMDVGLFALGGVAKAAELFNRTESQVVTTTGGGTVVSSSNPQRNIGAGIVEGGLNSVVPQISQRNQQAIAQMMQQTNVWLLGAGTQVEIYVNQPVQL